MYADTLKETLPRVREAIAGAADAAGRDASDVTLVAVTKGHPLEAVRAALEAGIEDLGENRVGELESKVADVGREGVRWHMIGHVQRRKAPRALAAADLIQSVDSLRLAERIDRVLDEGAPPVEVLFQVNTSGEEAKYGFDGEEALDRVLEASALPGLRSRGLMTMAPFTDDEAVLRRTFARLRELGERIREARPDFGTVLSMGMTNDLRIAVSEGSTMVRIGTALFGERP
ncbi:MAG: YggS family pyridoxal phosphate-dependent enzyme [Gemmatimonadota bacterium]|jgi:pyridoxal phosphate enzyme (YggS family)